MTPRGDVRFFSDRNTFSFSLPLSFSFPWTNDALVSSKEARGARIGRKGKPDIGDRASPSLFGRVSDNTHTVWRVPKDIDGSPPASPMRFHPDSDANRGQLRQCVPPFLPPRQASTPIEITLIYCGTERLARSIIRLSCR